MLIFSLQFQQMFEHLGGVWHDAIKLVLHISILLIVAVVSVFVRIVTLCLYTIVGIVGCFFVSLFSIVRTGLAVVATQAICFSCTISSSRQRTLFLHFLILVAYSSYLRDVDTTLHQLGNYLRIGGACAMLLGNKTHHLIIRHA